MTKGIVLTMQCFKVSGNMTITIHLSLDNFSQGIDTSSERVMFSGQSSRKILDPNCSENRRSSQS